MGVDLSGNNDIIKPEKSGSSGGKVDSNIFIPFLSFSTPGALLPKSDIVKTTDGAGTAHYASQAFLFDYKNGIREEYIGTEYDPWADERK